jgi:hypothetical protein
VFALPAGEKGADRVHRDGQGTRHVVAAVRAGEVVVLAVGDVQGGPLGGQLPRVGGGIVVRRDRDAIITVPFTQVEATPVDVPGDDERRRNEPPLRGNAEFLGLLGEFCLSGAGSRYLGPDCRAAW